MILILGATGYVGSKLIPLLLKAGHNVRVLVRDPAKLPSSFKDKVDIVQGDVLDRSSLPLAFEGISHLYYLVHSMSGGEESFVERDRLAAHNVAAQAAESRVGRVIYLGGLGVRGSVQSAHLRSRHEVGDILRAGRVPVTEFRAAVIVGSGSSSFEMVHHLVNRLPLMICPRWLVIRTQPIAVDDVLAYLVQAVNIPATASRILDIGGPEILTYRSMMLTVASVLELRRLLIQVPVLTPRLSSYWVNLVTPISADLARSLIESVRQETICENHDAEQLFDIRPMRYEDAVRRALAPVLSTPGVTELSSLSQLDPSHLLTDRQERTVSATPEGLFSVISSIGGKNGWYAANWLWQLRGFLDKLFGGVGMRRHRRDQSELIEGDILDFWIVEKLVPNRLLRLRAEMRVWGKAWLEFRIDPGNDGQVLLVQEAQYYPKGLGGLFYWYSIFPVHWYVFAALASSIRKRAELAESNRATG